MPDTHPPGPSHGRGTLLGLVLLLLGPLLSGCGESTLAPPFDLAMEGAAAVTVDRATYTFEGPGGPDPTYRHFRMAFEFRNPSPDTVSFLNCNGAFSLMLEKRVDGAWVMAWSPPMNLCLSPPIRVGPGETLEREITVITGRPGSRSHPQFGVEEIPGTYRLVLTSAYSGYDHAGPPWGQLLPLAGRVSRPFRIEEG